MRLSPSVHRIMYGLFQLFKGPLHLRDFTQLGLVLQFRDGLSSAGWLICLVLSELRLQSSCL